MTGNEIAEQFVAGFFGTAAVLGTILGLAWLCQRRLRAEVAPSVMPYDEQRPPSRCGRRGNTEPLPNVPNPLVAPREVGDSL
jgi:hypothetical protein